MNFFRGENEMKQWIKNMELDEENLFYLDIKTAFQVGKEIFKLEK